MKNQITELFDDIVLVERIKKKLPKFFQIAELESSRAGKVGMEVGSLRERIIVGLLIYKFGEKNVENKIPITESETDVKLFNEPISIKTITGKNLTGIKLIWTVDSNSAIRFKENYEPNCGMIFVQINWMNKGGLYYFSKSAQIDILYEIGRDSYIKLPKAGTNPRGAEITSTAMKALINHTETKQIEIDWVKEQIEYNPYERWIELWQQD